MPVFIEEELKLDFPEFNKREFGFVYSVEFKRKHQFNDRKQLIDFINMLRPKDCFVSVARYDDPKTMSGYLGSDLFFDFDRDDGKIFLLYSDVNLSVECLKEDFGFKKIVVNKSGFKGYHVIVFDKEVQDLSGRERGLIVQFIIDKYKVQYIDVQCTCDIHRLRRLEGSINSKSGLVCKRLITEGFDDEKEI